MKRRYHTITKKDRRTFVDFLVKNGQGLLPMVELIEQSWMAVVELIEVLGPSADRSSAEAVGRRGGGAVASGQERSKTRRGGRRDRVAWAWKRHGMPARAKVAGGAAPSAEEGSGEGWRGSHPGPRSDASRREAGPPDVGDSAAGALDAAVWSGVAGDGGDGGGVAVGGEPRGYRDERGRANVRAAIRRSRPAGDLSRWGAVRPSTRCWSQSAWMARAASTSWVWPTGRARIRWWRRGCWKTWCGAG